MTVRAEPTAVPVETPGAARDSAREWVENRPAARWAPQLDLGELWAYRELGLSFALRNLRLRYKQTFFGVAWALIQPLLAVLIFSIIFGRLAGLPTDGIPYPVFVYAGMMIWLYFAGSVTSAASCLVDNRELVSKVYFPRILAPAAAVIPGLLDFAISLLVFGFFMAIYDVVPSVLIVFVPFWVLATMAFAFAVGLWLSALNVKYRDVKHALGFLLQVWMFASPIVYSASLVEGGWRYLYALNPLVSILEGFRWSIAGGPPPGAPALVSLLVGIVTLTSGLVYFRRVERGFADLI